MMSSGRNAAMQTGVIYVCNLPSRTNEALLAEYFGTIGVLKKDKRTGRPKIWIYRDKVTNEPKGDATVTYEDPHAAAAAVEWFNDKNFHGNKISVSIAESKSKEPAEQLQGFSGTVDGLTNPPFASDLGSTPPVGPGASGSGRGRGMAEAGGKPWQQEGDWPCPNPSCNNINFAFRGECNLCGTARPAGGGLGGSAGGGRGKGRGSSDAGGRGRGPGGPPGLFGPNDWTCPMCGNINWAKRMKCNICNTNKPGHNEGGVREGRAGGYKEFDEAEIEETKRRRRELEEDDGEMYDEFGNLKKKFRMKAKLGDTQPQSQQSIAHAGKAGWDKEELGVIEKDRSMDRAKDRNRDGHRERSRDRSEDRDAYNGHRHSRSDEQDNDHVRDRNGERIRERDRDQYDDRAERDSKRERHRERSRDRDRDQERERSYDQDRDRDRNWDREERSRERLDKRGR